MHVPAIGNFIFIANTIQPDKLNSRMELQNRKLSGII